MDAPTTNGVDREPLLAMIRELVEHGADVNARTREVPPSRRWLYSLGDVSWVDFTGQTPFLRAALSGDVATMRLLLEHGADPNLPTPAGTTPLMAASGVNWVVAQTYTESPQSLLDAIQLCLEHGADVNAVNSMGLTALLGAANRGANDIIRLLAANGARLDVVDKEGRSALRWAEGVFLAAVGAERKPATIALLEELGAPKLAARAEPCAASRSSGSAAPPLLRRRRRIPLRSSTPPSAADHWALVDRYCVGCHNDAELAGELAFDRIDRADLAANAAVWETAIRKLRGHLMPPPGEPRPDEARVDALVRWLEQSLDAAARAAPNPGAPALAPPEPRRVRERRARPARRDRRRDDALARRRLERRLRQHRERAQRVAGAAVELRRGRGENQPARRRRPERELRLVTYRAPRGLLQAEHLDGQPLGTRGGMSVRHFFPLDAEYEIRVGRGGGGFGLEALGGDEEVEITVNGERAAVLGRGGPRTAVLTVPAGPQTLGVAIVRKRDAQGVDDLFAVHAPTPGITAVSIVGPRGATGVGDTPSRRRLFVCSPADAADGSTRARPTSCGGSPSARIAGPMSADDPAVATLLAFYAAGRAEGSFDAGIQRAVARVLVDPEFIFRFEARAGRSAAGVDLSRQRRRARVAPVVLPVEQHPG